MSSSDKPSSSRESTTYATSVSSSGDDARGRPAGRDSSVRDRSRESRQRVKSGYHTFTAFGREFCVEKRWKLVRELGSGAYGMVISVKDDITQEILAIKLITRVFDKIQLAKRALREITLLRHFNNHDNITGLIDMDVSGPDFNEIYLFMEPMEADLYQIIRSGQALTDAHIRYFIYQILRGVKFIHSADVIHRDLKPGNLLVNSDCELKICDLGLSRGYDSRARDNEGGGLTEYVATRWYRAPEIMLSFKRYNTAIDMWSIGCILGELLGGKPVFKGRDYVDQLNLILDTLGTPPEETIMRIGSEKARAYIRSLPFKKPVPFEKLYPDADPQAIDLLKHLLTFDPANRLNVTQALEHPFLAAYHDLDDEPDHPDKFERWRPMETYDTNEQFRAALYREVQEFRSEVRSIGAEAAAAGGYVDASEQPLSPVAFPTTASPTTTTTPYTDAESTAPASEEAGAEGPVPFPSKSTADDEGDDKPASIPAPSAISRFMDPYRTYARRTSIFSSSDGLRGPSQSMFGSSAVRQYNGLPTGSSLVAADATSANSSAVPDGVVGVVGGQGQGGYIIPARSRAASVDGALWGAPPQLLRQLSTISISRQELVEGSHAAERGNGNNGDEDEPPLAPGGHAKGAVAAGQGGEGGGGGGGGGLMSQAGADAPPSTIPSEWAARKSGSVSSARSGM